jgi:hypothetical protein
MKTYGTIFESLNIDLLLANDLVYKKYYSTDQYYKILKNAINNAYYQWCIRNNITDKDKFKKMLYEHYINYKPMFCNTRLNLLFTGSTMG